MLLDEHKVKLQPQRDSQ